MDVGGIGNNYINNSVQATKNAVTDEEFEKKLQAAMDKKDDAALKKACQDFEGLMLNMMYKQMKATVIKSDLIPGDIGRDVFESMLDDKLVEESTKTRNVGLADMLYKQLSRQSKSSPKPVEEGDAEAIEEK